MPIYRMQRSDKHFRTALQDSFLGGFFFVRAIVYCYIRALWGGKPLAQRNSENRLSGSGVRREPGRPTHTKLRSERNEERSGGDSRDRFDQVGSNL